MNKSLFLIAVIILSGCGNTNTLPVNSETNTGTLPVACTMDAKACDDGSFVGRVGPDCEFEACPNTANQTTPAKIVVNDISIENSSFAPATITIPVGSQITWINNDSVAHSVIASDNSFSSETLENGGVFTHIFTEAGTYEYNCGLHPMMKGTIIVE